MNQPNPTPQNFRDFIGGLVIVPILHVLFIVASISLMFIVPFFMFLIFQIALSQFLYLVPIILDYQRRGRLEVVKGILVAAFLTILLNGACATVVTPSDHPWAGSVRHDTIVITILSMLTLVVTAFYSLKPRSRPK
jgi:hypothetical protein